MTDNAPHAQNRFVILSMPRTGSTLLTALLQSHPQILCHNEPFNPNGVYAHHRILQNAYMRAYRDGDPVRFAEMLYSESDADQVVGFKILDYQAVEVQKHLLQSNDVKKIILRRGNILAAYSSNRIATEVRQWRVPADVEPRTTRIKFSAGPFDHYVRKTLAYYQHLTEMAAASNSPMIELEYRDLFDKDMQRHLLAFLGVATELSLHADLQRQNPPRMADRFVNWEDVVATLTKKNRQDWLHEDLE